MPPISNAKLVLGRIAADYAVPSYYEVQAAVHSQDGKSTTISTVQGTELQIEESSKLIPYVTKNIVGTADLVPGTKILVWNSATGQQQPPAKVMIFPYEYRGYAGLSDNSELFVNGQNVDLNAQTAVYTDADGNVMLPLRALSEALGLQVEWNKERMSAVIIDGEQTIFEIVLGKGSVTTGNGEEQSLLVPSNKVNGKAYMAASDLEQLLHIVFSK